MKRTLLAIIITTFAVFSNYGQIRKTPKSKRATQVQKIQEITSEKAVTENGKPVVLKSNGTWEFASASVVEQAKIKPCDLSLFKAPSIKALHIGISKQPLAAVLDIYQSSYKDPLFLIGVRPSESNGITTYDLANSDLRKLKSYWKNFYNINSLSLSFYNDDLYKFKVEYSESETNLTNEEFKLKISEDSSLPIEFWVKLPDDTQKLKCEEFEVQISSGRFLTVTDLLTVREIEWKEKSKVETSQP